MLAHTTTVHATPGKKGGPTRLAEFFILIRIYTYATNDSTLARLLSRDYAYLLAITYAAIVWLQKRHYNHVLPGWLSIIIFIAGIPVDSFLFRFGVTGC